jgi:hypothetical protein
VPPSPGDLIDLPLVTPITQEIMEEAEESNCVVVMAADVMSSPIPGVDVG